MIDDQQARFGLNGKFGELGGGGVIFGRKSLEAWWSLRQPR